MANSLMGKRAHRVAVVSHSDRTTTTTVGINVGIIPEETKPITSPRGQRIASREVRISVIHIYEDAIARGIKINGREGLIRAYTRDAKLRV